ncbi:MAG: oligopeptide transporter, OPT family [Sedimentisphaerales bacterium]|nr:oligopeptide transporter, OPT family [Sedimentisphaerales bacterium]
MDLRNQSLPEITIKGFILGILLAVILAAANAYLGLFAGMTVSATIPAAVISMGVLRFFKRNNILENNIVQTCASAGEAIAAGCIFTLPALILLGTWQTFDYKWVTIIAGFGGVLGVLFTIPLRRSFIVDSKLQFPEGIATAKVLESGQMGPEGLRQIIRTALAGGFFKVTGDLVGLWPERLQISRAIGSSVTAVGVTLSPALLAVGLIVGLNIGILMFAGGAGNWLVAIPIYSHFHPKPEDLSVAAWADQIWQDQTRFIGVGAMLVGGLWTVFKMRKTLLKGVTSGLQAYRSVDGAGQKAAEVPRTERDLPMKWILVLMVLSVIPLFFVYHAFVQKLPVSITMAVLMLIAGFAFSAVAGYMAGLVGSSNNPISGVTITTIVFSAFFLMLLIGKGAPIGPAAAIIIGAVVCCAASIAGDNLQDLKTGYIVGATPWKQQVMLAVGTLSGAAVIAPVLTLLQHAYGFAGQAAPATRPLPAPQANVMAAVAKGVFQGGLPWTFIFIGMAVAVGLIVLNGILERSRSSFRTPVLAVAIGFYLPFSQSVAIFIGGVIATVVKRALVRLRASKEAQEDSEQRSVLFASGLITGEALMGILVAIPVVLFKSWGLELPLTSLWQQKAASFLPSLRSWIEAGGAWFGLVLLLLIALWAYRVSRPSHRR